MAITSTYESELEGAYHYLFSNSNVIMRLSTGMSSLLTANGKDLSVKLVKMGGGLVPMPTRACSNRGMYVRLGIAHTKNLECVHLPK